MNEEDKDKKIKIFRNMVINIPLLDVIKQISKYAKFPKDLYTHKRRLKGNERVSMRINVLSLTQPKVPKKYRIEQNRSALTQVMPQKRKDPGTFIFPVPLGI